MKRYENEGVSPVLGTVLVFAIIVAGIGIIQNYYVPVWLENAENEKYLEMKSTFELLHEKVIEGANYGEAWLKLDPVMRYPKYPFMITPETVSSIYAFKRIGYAEIIYENNTPIREYITAAEFIPRFIYFKPSKESYILGEYFSFSNDGSGFRTAHEYIMGDNEIRILLLNFSRREITYPQYVELSGISILKDGNFTIKIVIEDPEYRSWYLDYLNDTLCNINHPNVTVTCNPIQNGKEININKFPVRLAIVGDGKKEDYIAKISEGIGSDLVFTTGKGGKENINESESSEEPAYNVLETFNITTTGGSGVALVGSTIYIYGTTPFPNTRAKVTIEYVFIPSQGGDKSNGTVKTEFFWSTMADGYFQLPVTIPASYRVPGGNELADIPDYINVTIELGGKTYFKSFVISHSGSEDEDEDNENGRGKK